MDQRIAGEFVDACRLRLRRELGQRRMPLPSPELDEALHRSVSRLLRREARRLCTKDSDVGILPATFCEEVGRWRASLTRHHIERLVRLRASQWYVAIDELLQRLTCDWKALVAHFKLSPEARLLSIGQPLGDPHHGGRSVYMLEFDDGHAVIYKPRPVSAEHTFGLMIQWLHRAGCEPGLMSCCVLPMSGYGWAEFVPSINCDSSDEAELFYYRQGAFLALFHLIGITDCLSENFVVSRDQPIWVDLECACGPQVVPERPLPQQSRALEMIKSSVLSTAALYHTNAGNVRPKDHTALSVCCVADRSRIFDERNIMRDRYIHAIVRGFCSVYSWLQRHGSKWWANGRMTSLWQGQKVRVLLRQTTRYMTLGDCIFVAPPELRQYAKEQVASILVDGWSDISWTDELAKAEVCALERGDVPYWSIETDGRDLREANGAVIRKAAVRTGIQSLERRVSQLSERDMENQAWLIDGFLRLPNTA